MHDVYRDVKRNSSKSRVHFTPIRAPCLMPISIHIRLSHTPVFLHVTAHNSCIIHTHAAGSRRISGIERIRARNASVFPLATRRDGHERISPRVTVPCDLTVCSRGISILAVGQVRRRLLESYSSKRARPSDCRLTRRGRKLINPAGKETRRMLDRITDESI